MFNAQDTYIRDAHKTIFREADACGFSRNAFLAPAFEAAPPMTQRCFTVHEEECIRGMVCSSIRDIDMAIRMIYARDQKSLHESIALLDNLKVRMTSLVKILE